MAIPDPTQKGDLLVADSVPDWQLLPVGINEQVLTVDDGEPLGVVWRYPRGVIFACTQFNEVFTTLFFLTYGTPTAFYFTP